MNIKSLKQPLAIAMWDFSWLERRWPGAGYEDWDRVLDELVERGYNAVRIDAYPHFVARDPHAEWTILPCWNQQNWGSPAKNRVTVQPSLNGFLSKCRERAIAVGLSTWFQRDPADSVRLIHSPSHLGRIWVKTLETIAEAGLLDTILYVDLCNEWPFAVWAPFFNPDDSITWNDPRSLHWMQTAIETVREAFPDISYTFSHTGPAKIAAEKRDSIGFLDFLEPHVWMVHANDAQFYRLIDYNYEKFDTKGYENVVAYAQRLYESDPDYWNALQERYIESIAEESRATGLPLITTECWGIVDYKDWPLLDWEWVKRSCENGIRCAAQTGRWIAMATSNFCGPQHVGMWRDAAWHREMTGIIRAGQQGL
jgi:hypothetical protein